MSWYTASNSTNQIVEQLIYGEWLYYKIVYMHGSQEEHYLCNDEISVLK
jgi:hypothetical protein